MPQSIGLRIFSVRKTWKWSQKRLSKLLGINQATISWWESGIIIPSGASTVALCALFGCTREALETGEGWKIPEAPATLPVFEVPVGK